MQSSRGYCHLATASGGARALVALLAMGAGADAGSAPAYVPVGDTYSASCVLADSSGGMYRQSAGPDLRTFSGLLGYTTIPTNTFNGSSSGIADAYAPGTPSAFSISVDVLLISSVASGGLYAWQPTGPGGVPLDRATFHVGLDDPIDFPTPVLLHSVVLSYYSAQVGGSPMATKVINNSFNNQDGFVYGTVWGGTFRYTLDTPTFGPPLAQQDVTRVYATFHLEAVPSPGAAAIGLVALGFGMRRRR